MAHARGLAGCSLLAWAGWVESKQEVLHRAMRWWAHHKMLPVADRSSSLPAPSDSQQGVQAQPTPAHRWIKSVQSSTFWRQELLHQGKMLVPKSLLVRALDEWALVALHRLKRQAS